MGKCMNLYSYDYNKLINKIKEFCKTDNIYKIEEILNYFGNKIGDKYIILDQVSRGFSHEKFNIY